MRNLERPHKRDHYKLKLSVHALLVVLCPIVIASCASIESFQASPRNICLGDSVTISWQATGLVDLEANPSLPHTGFKNPSGSEQFTVQQTTRFVLNARCLFSRQTAEADVVVVANTPKEFGGLASCEMPEQGMTLTVPLQAPQVSSALRVSSVTNMNSRPIILSKENVRVTILAGQTSSAFDHLSAQGTWEIQAPLNPNEPCEDALAEVRDRLTFRIAFACGE